MNSIKTIDLDLVQKCQQGETQAFDSLYDIFGDMVWRLCYRMTGNATEAEDITQEVWVTVWQRIGSFRCESSFNTWLYRIASNACLQWLRKSRNRPECSLNKETTVQSRLESDMIGRDELSHLQSALSNLPESLRLPLVLKVYEDMSYAEISEVLCCTAAAVKMRICRARAVLAAAMEEMK